MKNSPSPALPRLAPRRPDSHKGDYGRALLVGGSRGMSGAVSLAAMATVRGGAGLVTVATPSRVQEIVASFDPCYMTFPLGDDAAGRISLAARQSLTQLSAGATCIGYGPGLGRSSDLEQLTIELYTSVEAPMICDADALFALASSRSRLIEHVGARVLTPHPGEFQRLVDADFSTRDEMEQRAIQLADSAGIVVVLKGPKTLVTDGKRNWHNTTGNPGMATGGSGDVLTGIIAALICQGLDPLAAAMAGVHVHGMAGDLAAARLGQPSLIATDLIHCLPQAMQSIAPS